MSEEKDEIQLMMEESLGGEQKSDVDTLIDADAGGQQADEEAKDDDDHEDGEHEEEEEADTGDGDEADSDEDAEDGKSDADELDVPKYFEGFDSLEDVKQTLQRGKQFSSEIEQELNTLRQSSKELQSLNDEVKQLKERQPFNDVRFYQLDKLSKTDPDKAAILMRYAFGDNSAESVVKLQMMLEHPSTFEKNPGFLQRQIEKKYAEIYSGDFTPEDEEYRDAQTAMELDADNAKKLFDSEIAKVDVPKMKTDEEKKAETEAFFKSWVSDFSKVKSELSAIDIPVLDEKDNSKTNSYMSFEIPKDDLKQVYELAANHIAQSRIEPSAESVKQAVDVAKAVYFWQHRAEINTKFANNLMKEAGTKVMKKVNNPAKAGADVHKNNKSQNKGDAAETIFNEITQGL